MPFLSSTTISPSSSAARAGSLATAAAMFGNFSLQSRPLRVSRRTSPWPSRDAVAVELDLVRPARPARGRRAQGCKRRRHEVRQSRAARPPLLVLGAVLAAFLRGGRTTRAARTLLRGFARARAPRGGVAF